MVVFDLIVKRHDSKASLMILEYIYTNITKINKLNVKINIVGYADVDLDDTVIDKLKKDGITHFPTLLTPQKTYQGEPEIRALFEKNFAADRPRPPPARDTSNVRDYLTNNILDDRGWGNEDRDESMSGQDFSKKMESFRKRREKTLSKMKGHRRTTTIEPKQARQPEPESDDEPEEERPRRRNREPEHEPDHQNYQDDGPTETRGDNILDSVAACDEGDIDSAMMRQYWINNTE